MDGHDSKEDANAAGDLVRFKLGEEWRSMVKDGWVIEGRGFRHREGKELIPTTGGRTKADELKGLVMGAADHGTKRTREYIEAEEKKSEEAKRQKYGGLDY